MKSVSYLLIAVMLFITTIGVAQDDPKTLTVFYYDLMIDDNFRASEKGAGERIDDMKETFKGKDPLVEGIIDEVYNSIETRIESENLYDVLPVDALRNSEGKQIFHSTRDYPMGTKKAAISHNTSEYYVRMNVRIVSRLTTEKSNEVLGYRNEKKKLRPMVMISYNVFDSKGNKVAKYKGQAKTKEVINVKSATIQKWFEIGEQRRLQDDDNVNVLNEVLEEAIDDLIANMKE